MSFATIQRLSGIALLLGGALAALGTIGEAINDNPLSSIWIPAALATALGLLLVILGLPALYALQMKQAGRLGLIGFILFFLASVLFGGSSGVTDLVLLPMMTPAEFNNPSRAFIVYFLIAKLLILAGAVVFGIALLRAGVVSKGSAILLLVGSVLFILGGRAHVPYLDFIGEALFFLSFAWFGFSLLSSVRGEALQALIQSSAGAKSRA